MNMPESKQQEPKISKSEPELQGRLLFVARAVWLLFLLIVLSLFGGNVIRPLFSGERVIVCPLAFTCVDDDGLPYTLETRQVLAHAHIPLATYDIFVNIFGIVFALVFWGMGALLFWRKFEQPVGMLAAFAFLLIGANSFEGDASNVPGIVLLVVLLLQLCQSLSLGLFLVAFPDGRFVPRWSWLIGCTLFVQALFFILPPPINIFSWQFRWIVIELVLAYGSPIVMQVYRYIRIFTPMQRQQTKWVIFGLVIALLCLFMGFFAGGLFPAFSILQLLSDSLSSLGFLLIPVSVSVAILRSRLWDIDVIINRTLVYGLLTLILVLIYSGLVLGVPFLLVGIVGRSEGVVTVCSTLVVAGLFQPLRRGIQNGIDRRFYRRKYNAANTLLAFSSTLQQEVDLERLSERLVMVVQETVQPIYISLWLLKREDKTSPSLLEGPEEAAM